MALRFKLIIKRDRLRKDDKDYHAKWQEIVTNFFGSISDLSISLGYLIFLNMNMFQGDINSNQAKKKNMDIGYQVS